MIMNLDIPFVESCDKDDSRLKGEVQILGVSHHLTLIRVRDVIDANNPGESIQLGTTSDNEADLDQILWIAGADAFQTVAVPGFEGRYVCYLYPYERS